MKEVAQEERQNTRNSIEAQKNSIYKRQLEQQVAAETSATGDKLRVSLEPNLFDDYINPAAMIGAWQSNLGISLQAEQSDSVVTVCNLCRSTTIYETVGGLGAKTTTQFANNIVNPLAGTGDLVNNLGNKYLLPNAYKLNQKHLKPVQISFIDKLITQLIMKV
jgi:hypothetical protein